MKHAIIQKIFDALIRQKFADWYGKGGRFDNWICSEQGAPSEEEIRSDIEKMFQLQDLS